MLLSSRSQVLRLAVSAENETKLGAEKDTKSIKPGGAGLFVRGEQSTPTRHDTGYRASTTAGQGWPPFIELVRSSRMRPAPDERELNGLNKRAAY
jgi:hypothetical protein